MRVCVVSDLHCRKELDTSEASTSILFANSPRKPIVQNPLASMIKVIEDQKISCDIVVCLGDLGDRADEQGIMYSWNAIEEIRIKLNADVRIGIPGNHDINSRNQDGKDPFEYVRNFHEGFPTNNEQINTNFWGNGYGIFEGKNYVVLLINTVHDHNCSVSAAQSNISIDTIEQIRAQLSEGLYEDKSHKICLMHHHPIKHSDITNWRDSDSVDKGDELLRVLTENDFSIVLHGHKHQPRIKEDNGLPIFAAGSFSSIANLKTTGLNTMFHIVELEPNKKKGLIRSWEYNIRFGWEKSNNKQFPEVVGFGATNNIKDVGDEIFSILKDGDYPCLYSTILEKIPCLDYLTPIKLQQLSKYMGSKYEIYFEPAFPQKPNIITKK